MYSKKSNSSHFGWLLALTIAVAVAFFCSSGTEALGKNIELKMVFVPASEKGDESDYINLIKIVEKLSGISIKPIKVTDYNAAVEAMRADRAQIAWYGGKTYIIAAKIADAEAFVLSVSHA